mmetsp:Transcript_123898/g.264109  ORF Transcript_123898/g.264109 Transcript_123898/m.264109 type:complete len:211 (-) Transcript_123898:744-1376(-)
MQLDDLHLLLCLVVDPDDTAIQCLALSHDVGDGLAIHLHLLLQHVDLADDILGVGLQHPTRELDLVPFLVIQRVAPLQLVVRFLKLVFLCLPVFDLLDFDLHLLPQLEVLLVYAFPVLLLILVQTLQVVDLPHQLRFVLVALLDDLALLFDVLVENLLLFLLRLDVVLDGPQVPVLAVEGLLQLVKLLLEALPTAQLTLSLGLLGVEHIL